MSDKEKIPNRGLGILAERGAVDANPDGEYFLTERFIDVVNRTLTEQSEKLASEDPEEGWLQLLILGYLRFIHPKSATKEETRACVSTLDALFKATQKKRLDEWSMLLRVRR